MTNNSPFNVLFANAGPLFEVAKTAYERMREVPDREPHQMDALVALVFSAASLEAFINECAHLANSASDIDREWQPPAKESFGALLEETESLHGSIKLKFLLAHLVFAGQVYEKGSSPWQDFSLLIDLRNALIHLKPLDKVDYSFETNKASISPPKIVNILRSKNITAEAEGDDQWTTWVRLISTRAVARWACNVAVEMVQSILTIIPECSFKDTLHFFYSKFFQPIN